MKKILLFLLLVFPIVAKAQLELPFPIKLVNSSPVDFWYFESDGTPYDNTGEVISQVLSAIRYRGMTFNVNGVEYWFKDGITDGDLIAKGGSSVDTTAFIKTQGTSIATDDVIIKSHNDWTYYSEKPDFTVGTISESFRRMAWYVDDFLSISVSDSTGTKFGGIGIGVDQGGFSYTDPIANYSFGYYAPSKQLYFAYTDQTSSGDNSGIVVQNTDSIMFDMTRGADYGDNSYAGINFDGFFVGADNQRYFEVDSSGAKYKTNLASGFTDRHLVDKHYVDSVATGGGGGGADALGTYLVQTATNAPANAQIMGSLATGIVKNTTTTGVQSIAVAADFPTLNQNTTGNAATVTTNANLTGDVTSVGNATAIASGVIVNADINASAAIGATKLIDGSITDTELGYINTLSSNAQTQITAREVLTNKATDLSTFNSTLYPTTASLFARRDVTGTDAIVQADNGKTIYFNSGSPFNFTIDALTTNSSVYFYNKGSATVTFVDGSGVTSTGVTSLAAGESGGIIYESSTTPIILGTPSGGGGGLTVGTSTITSGTNTKVLYNNSGVLGEYTVSGTGNVALTTSPVFTTPNIGTATGTASGNYSLASGGTATGKNTFAMGSNPFILTSGVTTGTGATAGIQNVFNSLTTGNGLDISSSSVSSGAIVKITGTGTAAASNTQRGLVVDVSGANATSSQTTYGGYFSDTKTGTGSTNIGLYATATGGTTNYAIYSNGIIYTNSDLRLLSGNSINWDANGDKIIKIQSNVMTLSTFGDFAFRTWGGAAYAERFRISDTYTAIGGGTSATAFRYLEPSGSGTNYSSFKAVAQSANINYSLPPTVAVAGAVLTDVAGNGVLTWEDKSLQSATNTKTEKVIYNVGTIGSAATSTYSIHAESYYANGTTLLAKITVVAVKTDGSASAHSTVTARFRKNSSGTWSVDDAGTDITSDITILADVVGDFSTNPNVKVTMGAASGNYNVSWVAETIEVK